MISIGIIPAAGKSERFGGIWKEMLPAKDSETLLRKAVNQLSFIEGYPMIVTRKEKLVAQASFCPECDYVLQKVGQKTLHAAIMTGVRYIANQYFVVMPDTIFDPSVKEMFGDKLNDPSIDLYLGCFWTHKPNRFGVEIGGEWFDKPDIPDQDELFKAWGFFGFSNRLKQDFARMEIHEFFNYCYSNKNIKIAEAEMTSYYDMATIKDYKEYLCS